MAEPDAETKEKMNPAEENTADTQPKEAEEQTKKGEEEEPETNPAETEMAETSDTAATVDVDPNKTQEVEPTGAEKSQPTDNAEGESAAVAMEEVKPAEKEEKQEEKIDVAEEKIDKPEEKVDQPEERVDQPEKKVDQPEQQMDRQEEKVDQQEEKVVQPDKEKQAEDKEEQPKEEQQAVPKEEKEEVDVKPADDEATAEGDKDAGVEGNNTASTQVTETEAADAPPPTTPAEDKQTEPDTNQEGADKSGAEPSEPAENSLVPQEIPSATVKFVLLPTAQVATMKCALNQTLRELKDHFALELKIPAGVILLLHDGANVENERTLEDLGVGPNGTVQLEMQSADPINTPIKAFRPRQEYVMPDVITVRVETEPKRYKDIVVEVERSTRKKPFLGGYRHKETNVEFHHASAQTGQKARATSNVERYCRDTQTYQMKHIRQQTSEDTSTQMTKIGVYVSNMSDKLIVPGKYTTAEQHHKMILQKVVILQKYWRRWLALRYVTKLKWDRQRRLDWEKQEEIKKREEKEMRIKKEFERRMNPKTKEDFDLLYAALEKWRLEEMDKINSSLSGAERKAALCQLLDQETQLIGSIGRHKKDADTENKDKIVLSFLNKAAAPKKWRGPDGCFTEMDTPYTIRAQELRDIYNSISMKYLTQDERLDVLLTLKHTVKEHDCKLTQEIIELIDREADLLMRGIRDTNLEGLRKRISTLFLQYIKTPTFNPEAARLLKVPQDPSTLRQNIYYCASCNQYLPSVEFQLSTNSRTVGRCRKCRHLDNDARTRQDYSHYRLMLRELRRVEESYGDDSKVAFLLQENDLRYLVEKIWNSQSIVSAWDDLYDLILVRWDKHKEWSPWNCVLVTKEESSAHEKLETLTEGYGKELIHKIHRKHALARNYFSRLPGMSEHMRKRVTEPKDGPSVEVISVN